MRKRILSLVVITVMVLAMLLSGGCGKNETSDTGNQTDNTGTKPAGTETTQEENTKDDTKDNTKDNTGDEKPLSNKERFEAARGTTITIIGSEPGTNASQDDEIKYFEDNYGIKVNVYVGKDDETTVMKLIAAGTPPDVVNLTNTRLFTYIQAAALLPLEDLMDVKDPLFNQPLIDTCTWRGHVFGVNGDPLVKGYLVNKTMFENNGLETPYSLYKKGEWNWNTFREACIALTQDTNKDGEKDVWGANMDMGDVTIFPQSNGADWLIVDKNEPKITFGLDDPRAIEALQFVQDCLVKDKCLTNQVKKQEWPNGKLAMTYESYGAVKKWIDEGLSFDWEFVPFPAGPSGTDGAMPGTIGRWGVPRGAANPLGGAAFIYAKTEYAAQSTSFEELYEPEVWAELMELRKVEFIPNNKLISSDSYSAATSAFEEDFLNGVPVATIIEKVKPLYEAAINDFLVNEKSAWENLSK